MKKWEYLRFSVSYDSDSYDFRNYNYAGITLVEAINGVDLFDDNKDKGKDNRILLDRALRDYGEQGWELVSVVNVSKNHTNYVFKRPIAG